LDITHQYGEKGLALIKTKEKHKITLSKRLYELLWAYTVENEYTFKESNDKVPKDFHRIDKDFDKIMPPDVFIQKKERGLCFHSWRHFFNTYLLAEKMFLTPR
jgi:integrase